jgi:hypothetical protein
MFPAALIDKKNSSGLTLVLKKQEQEYDELDLTRALTEEENREDEQDEPGSSSLREEEEETE